MGVSTDGLLVFGINFGEELPEPFRGYEEFDLDEIIADEGGLTIWRDNMTDEESTAYWARKKELVEASPVTHVMHCSWQHPDHIFAVRGFSHRAARGFPEKIGVQDLDVPFAKIEAFKKWLTDHGVDVDEEPVWFLASMWG